MQKICKRLAAFLLAAALVLMMVPQAAFADTGSTDTMTETAAVTLADTSDDSAQGSSSDASADTSSDTNDVVDSGDTQSEEIVTETVTTYDLDISVKTTPVSSKKKILKKVTVTIPVLTTTVKDAETGEEISVTSQSFTLTLECRIKGAGWITASLNDAGTAYELTASKAASGSYIQAIRITPSASLKKAMKQAGVSLYYSVKAKGIGQLGWAASGQKAGTTIGGAALKGILLKTAEGIPGSGKNHFVSSAGIRYKTKTSGKSGWSAVKKNGKTSGTASASSKLKSLSVSLKKTSASAGGGIQYRVRTTKSGGSQKWSSWKKNGKSAGNSKIQTVQIELTGDIADYYNIYYRVYLEHYGWLDWAKNGESAGAAYSYFAISAVQIKLVSKGQSAPGKTKEAYIDSISGNSKLDSYLAAIYKKKGTDLKTLFHYVTTFTYYRTYETPTGDWSIQYAIEQYENHGGNCYRFAALFSWLARGLGYNAKTVKGYVPSTSGGWAPHGWVEIRLGGKTYICDPDLAKFHPSSNWYFRTYSNPPTTYRKSS